MQRIPNIRLNPYGLAVVMVIAATLVTHWLFPVLDAETYALFDAVAVVIAWYGGIKVGLLTVALSVLAINVFLLKPQTAFPVSSGEDIWHLVLSTLILLLIVVLTSELHHAHRKLEQLSNRKLQQKEEQLQLALTAAQIGIWHWDMVTGEITWSVEHETIFGLAPGSFDGRYATFEASVHPSDRGSLDRAIQQAIRQRNSYCHEYRVVWRDGSIHWVEGRGKGFYDATRQPIRMAGTVLNIDHRKQAEEHLRRYERIVATSPDLIALIDHTYTYQMVNRTYQLRFQKRYEQIVGRSVAEIIGSQVFETEIKPQIDRALAGERLQHQLWYNFPISKNRYLNIAYTPYLETDRTLSAVVVHVRDLTNLKQTEAQLHQSEEHLRQILQQMPVMLDAFDAEGQIICWNHECERITGFSADEVIGNPTIMESFYPDATYRQQMMADWERCGNDYRNWEWELTCKDGTTRTIAWSNISNQFSVPGWAAWGIGVDVTEQNQATSALNRLVADLERQITEYRVELQQERQQRQQLEQQLRQQLGQQLGQQLEQQFGEQGDFS